MPYFHLVFTLPAALGPLALQNPRVVYGLLMRAVAQTLSAVAARPKHLGAEIGFLAVLHTWGQNLMHHPHVHCVIPAGGLAPDGSRWISARPKFFLPVRVLSRVFRGKFIHGLKRARVRGEFKFHGDLAELAREEEFERLLDQVVTQDWVVYAQPPFGGPKHVLKYLARYTHRVALSNRRLVSLLDDHVTFRWKDYAHGSRQRLMTLKAVEFIRRFLLHVLPGGVVKIRHYGFMANRFRQSKLQLCRRLLGITEVSSIETACIDPPSAEPLSVRESEPACRCCPRCSGGHMWIIERLLPQRSPPRTVTSTSVGRDTS